MANFKKTQNSFAAGEISSDFFGRNIPSALSKLENISVSPTGVLSRRNGTIRVDQLYYTDNVIIPFDSEYLIVISPSTLSIYKNNVFFQSFVLDFAVDSIYKIQWVKRFNTMIFVNPNARPKVLEKGSTNFSYSNFIFAKDSDNYSIMPYMRFQDTENVTLTLSTHTNGTNWANVASSSGIWTTDSVGGTLMLLDRKWTIYSRTDSSHIVIFTTNSFTMPTSPISDWEEAAFSTKRGWPRAITFHQDRLVFGGSRDWPCGLWMSKTGLHTNFDTGTGLDDEAIFLTLLSDIQQKICTCISGRDLQILTDSGEWTISSTPLTPSTIDIRQHTSIGTVSDRFVPPQKVSGNTIFVSKNEIQEFALDELGENYNAINLSLMAQHLTNTPVSMAYNQKTCQLFVVEADGTMSVLTKQEAAEISAWGVYKTEGTFSSVAAIDGKVYVAVTRGSQTFLEMFSEGALTDSGTYEFEWKIAGTPLLIENHSPSKIRIHHASVRVMDAEHIKICGEEFYFEDPFSGDVTANVLGTSSNSLLPLWELSSSEQVPIKILSVTIDGTYEL